MSLQLVLEISFCEVWIHNEIHENLGRFIYIGSSLELLFGGGFVESKEFPHIYSVAPWILLLLQLLPVGSENTYKYHVKWVKGFSRFLR